MVSKNNHQILKQRQTNQVPHYGLRKLSIGVASVLLSTTFYLGAATAHADTNTSSAAVSSASVKPEQAVQPSAANTTQLNAQSQVAASAQPSAADTTQPDSQSQAQRTQRSQMRKAKRLHRRNRPQPLRGLGVRLRQLWRAFGKPVSPLPRLL